jgi:hypothetical protein
LFITPTFIFCVPIFHSQFLLFIFNSWILFCCWLLFIPYDLLFFCSSFSIPIFLCSQLWLFILYS